MALQLKRTSTIFLEDTSAEKQVAKPVAQPETQSQKSLICNTDNYLYISFLLYLL